MKNIFSALFVIILFGGCASYQGKTVLAPQQSPTWKQDWGYSNFHFQCNQGDIEVFDIVLSIESSGYTLFYFPVTFDSKEDVRKLNEKTSGLLITFRKDTPIESCDLAYVHLVEAGSGETIRPTSMEKTASYTYCVYYFDLKKDPQMQYDLYISKDVFNCEIKPIRYKYKKGYENWPVQLM